MTGAKDVVRRSLEKALRRGFLEEAEALLARLRRMAPLEPATRGLELEFLLAARRVAEAQALAERLIVDHPQSPRIVFLAGKTAYARRAYTKAIELFEEARRLNDHWRVRQWLGKALTQAGRFDEAEPLLEAVVAEHPFTAPDLAWLYERRGELDRAITVLESYSKTHPGDRWVRGRLEELQAAAMAPEQLMEEVETLRELGEPIPPELTARYVESLLETGDGGRVRRVLENGTDDLDRRSLLKIGWACHRFGLPDLAVRLFLEVFGDQPDNVKFLTALEKDARLAGRVEDVIEAYRALAPEKPKLWGRIRRLSRDLERIP